MCSVEYEKSYIYNVILINIQVNALSKMCFHKITPHNIEKKKINKIQTAKN